jgi:hypothetical protein
MRNILLAIKNMLVKSKEFCIKYKKKIITVIGVGILTIAIISGAAFGIVYYKASSSIKYSQEQMQEIALQKVQGEVVDVEKDLNCRNASFVYEFKIKDKDNTLKEVKVDSKYGTLVNFNNEKHNRESRFRDNKDNQEHNKNNKENRFENGQEKNKSRD